MAFPFYGADGTSGTVAVTNGSKTVTGTGTNWLTNNAVPPAGGYAIKFAGGDGEVYGIDSCTAEGTLTLCENYGGSTASGLSYYILPVAAAVGKLMKDVSTLLTSGSYSQLAGLSPTNGDFVQYVSSTWATRTALQTLLNLCNSMSEVSVASASTCDIGAATSPKVSITGTTTITGLGTQANAVRWVRFAGALILTHNSSSLILPGGQNITTAAGDTAMFVSDASGNWRCWKYQRASGAPVVPSVIYNYLSGLVTSNNATTPNSKIDVAAGQCADSSNAAMLILAAGTIDCGTTGANGLDAGSLANSTTYHNYAIGKTDGTTAFLASTSASAPTLPSGYTLKRRIGSFRTNGSAQILGFTQLGDEFLWKSKPQDATNTAFGSTSAVLKALTVPIGIQVGALFTIDVSYVSTSANYVISSPDDTDNAANSANRDGLVNSSIIINILTPPPIRTDTSGRIRLRSSQTDPTYNIYTRGWMDTRGK